MSGPPEKVNPFKPVQPVIPGVPQKPAEDKVPAENRPEESTVPPPVPSKPPWQSPQILAAAGAGAVLLLCGAALAWRALQPAPAPEPVVIEAPAEPQDSSAGSAGQTGSQAIPVAPGPVAKAAALEKPWSVVKFQMQRPTREMVNAMVIRLPSPPGYWGLLSVAPYGRCDLGLETDLRKIREQYSFAAIHPMVVDSCTQTVYDPLSLGSSSGVWIRGKIVAGPGIRPPYEVEIKLEQGEVIASRSE